MTNRCTKCKSLGMNISPFDSLGVKGLGYCLVCLPIVMEDFKKSASIFRFVQERIQSND